MTALKSSREYHLRRKYGITIAEYNRIRKAQGDCCAVCARHHSVFKVNLAVDHDHKTGEIFGLLCTHCNRRVIGRERDWKKFEAAAKYLQKGLGIYVPIVKKRKRKSRKRKS